MSDDRASAHTAVPSDDLRWQDGGQAIASPDGSRVALGAGSGNVITVRSLPSGRLLRTLGVTPGEGSPRAFSPDGRLLAAYADNVVKVWDLQSGQLVRAFAGPSARSPRVPGRRTAGCSTRQGWTDRSWLGTWRGTRRWRARCRWTPRRRSLRSGPPLTRWSPVCRTAICSSCTGRTAGSSVPPESGRDRLARHRAIWWAGHPGRRLRSRRDLDGLDGKAGRFLGKVGLPKAELEPQVWVADDGVTAATMRTAGGPLYLIDLRTRAVRTVPLHLDLPRGSLPYGVFRWTHQGQVVVAAGNEQHAIATALIVDVRTGRVLHRVPVPGDPYRDRAEPGRHVAGRGRAGRPAPLRQHLRRAAARPGPGGGRRLGLQRHA